MRHLDMILLGEFGEPGRDLIAFAHGDLECAPGASQFGNLHSRRLSMRRIRRTPDIAVFKRRLRGLRNQRKSECQKKNSLSHGHVFYRV